MRNQRSRFHSGNEASGVIRNQAYCNPHGSCPTKISAHFSLEFCGSPVAQASACVVLIWVGAEKSTQTEVCATRGPSRCVSILPRESLFRSLLPGVSVKNAGWCNFTAVSTHAVTFSPRPDAIFDSPPTIGHPGIILAGATPRSFEEMTLVIQEQASRNNLNRTS
jgi:hypothetical protein